MLSIDFSRLSKIDLFDSAYQKDRDEMMTGLPEFLKGIKSRGQGFYEVVFDRSVSDDILSYTNSVEGTYTDIVVLGIGGSALGLQTLRDSLSHLYKSSDTNLYILDNIDPTMIQECREVIALETTLFIVISKSGGTPETLASYSYFKSQLEQNDLPITDHFVFITGPDGFLREESEKFEAPTFTVPENVGGRFSVQTCVGLVPAALIGIDIEDFMKGGADMAKLFLSEKSKENIPFILALHQYLLGERGMKNVVMMPYVQKLKTFSDWYAQLLAESTGKINKEGKHVGFSPVAALGATDQHSQLQLYTQGPNDKQLVLIKSKELSASIKIPDLGEGPKTEILKGVTFEQLLYTEMRATADTLTEENRANYSIEIDKVDAYHLGQLVMLFEGATAFLGEFLEIDAFNQPGVERSKVLTREYLQS